MLDNKQLRALRAGAVSEAGNRVANAIELCGKTQNEIADDLEMTAAQLSDIKHGRFPDPKLSTLRKLADYFGCTIEDLFPSRAA